MESYVNASFQNLVTKDIYAKYKQYTLIENINYTKLYPAYKSPPVEKNMRRLSKKRKACYSGLI